MYDGHIYITEQVTQDLRVPRHSTAGQRAGAAFFLSAVGTLVLPGALVIIPGSPPRPDYAAERRVRDAAKLFVIHQLVHALQDQRLGSSRLRAFETTDAYEAYRALLEGDATLVEWRAGGVPRTPGAFEAFRQQLLGPGQQGGEPLPVQMAQVLRYADGLELASALFDRWGTAGVDAALFIPPSSTAQVNAPGALLRGRGA